MRKKISDIEKKLKLMLCRQNELHFRKDTRNRRYNLIKMLELDIEYSLYCFKNEQITQYRIEALSQIILQMKEKEFLYIDSIESKQNKREKQLLFNLIRQSNISCQHVNSKDNPIIWIADYVAGAFNNKILKDLILNKKRTQIFNL